MSLRHSSCHLDLIFGCLVITSTVWSQQGQRGNDRKGPPPLKFYQGRKIAQTMHYSGAEWLIRNEREREERDNVNHEGQVPGQHEDPFCYVRKQ